MRISLLIEGRTEKAFLPHLRRFLASRLIGRMPHIDPVPYNGRIPTGNKLQRVVHRLLSDRRSPADAVIALTDVYTGKREFADATDAKSKMRSWVGPNGLFHPHAAQYEFEAWLLVYWSDIQKLAGHNKQPPGVSPENVNHSDPPSKHLQEIFRIGSCRGGYVKARDANRILEGKDILVSALACPELKAFLNTILTISGGEPIK
ncbi:MAG: DUF4276 family protein [Syntrophobacteraceae bacterium]